MGAMKRLYEQHMDELRKQEDKDWWMYEGPEPEAAKESEEE